MDNVLDAIYAQAKSEKGPKIKGTSFIDEIMLRAESAETVEKLIKSLERDMRAAAKDLGLRTRRRTGATQITSLRVKHGGGGWTMIRPERATTPGTGHGHSPRHGRGERRVKHVRKRGLTGRFSSLRQKMGVLWPVMAGLCSLAVIFSLGVASFMIVEGWDLFDSVYMMIITLSTVGYGEVHPLTRAGKVVASLVILFGVGTFFYLAGAIVQLVIEGHIQNIFGRRWMQQGIAKMKGHTIVCGYGRIGGIVAREIIAEGHDVVVVERGQDLIEELQQKNIHYVSGDATRTKCSWPPGWKTPSPGLGPHRRIGQRLRYAHGPPTQSGHLHRGPKRISGPLPAPDQGRGQPGSLPAPVWRHPHGPVRAAPHGPRIHGPGHAR